MKKVWGWETTPLKNKCMVIPIVSTPTQWCRDGVLGYTNQRYSESNKERMWVTTLNSSKSQVSVFEDYLGGKYRRSRILKMKRSLITVPWKIEWLDRPTSGTAQLILCKSLSTVLKKQRPASKSLYYRWAGIPQAEWQTGSWNMNGCRHQIERGRRWFWMKDYRGDVGVMKESRLKHIWDSLLSCRAMLSYLTVTRWTAGFFQQPRCWICADTERNHCSMEEWFLHKQVLGNWLFNRGSCRWIFAGMYSGSIKLWLDKVVVNKGN